LKKKNDNSDESFESPERGNEDYKVLNYSNRNAQN